MILILTIKLFTFYNVRFSYHSLMYGTSNYLKKQIHDQKWSIVRKSCELKEDVSLVTVFCRYNLVLRHSF